MEEKRSYEASRRHKHKKEKKHKKHKKSRNSSDSDSGNEMEWVEAPAPKTNSSEDKREDWMKDESFVSTLTKEEMRLGLSSRERKKAAQEEELAKEEQVKQARELNPHWKDNGSGIPKEESKPENLRLPASSVGDGGYSYLKKAYLRIQEQAQREGCSMEEIAVERWGSLSKLESMIEEAETRMKSLSQSRYGSHKSKYRSDHTHNRTVSSDHFKRPSDHRKSPSPEKTFRFQKPKDYDNNRKKTLNVSRSSEQRQRYHNEKVFFSEERNDSSHCNKERELEEKDYMVWERSNSTSQNKSHVPAWKKVKKEQDNGSKSYSEERKFSPEESYRDQSPSATREIEKSTKEAIVICSEDDLNRLAAKHLKAELLGDVATATRLKAEYDEAKERFKTGRGKSSPQVSSRKKERVMLTKMDSSGQQQPLRSSREEAGFDRHSGSKKQSNKFFDDTSRYSLKQMFEREKLTTADDNIEMFLDVASKSDERIKENENETSGISKKAVQRMAHSVQEEKDISKAMKQHQQFTSALENCHYCMDQPNMKHHLIVSVSEQVYLSIPNFQSLTEHHCLIVPKRHVPSFLTLDEDEWNDVEEMKSLLRRFFADQQKSLLCIETSMNFKRCPHAVLECIPVPIEEGDMAPLYFKKALLESEEEWAHNIKLVDLTKKGLRRSIPKNLPYFFVTFDPSVHAGFAHVIEDEKYFPRNFGKEVIGGMLDIDYNHLYKNKKDYPLKKSKETLEFTRLLEAFKNTQS